jgi:hypothetical protein
MKSLTRDREVVTESMDYYYCAEMIGVNVRSEAQP